MFKQGYEVIILQEKIIYKTLNVKKSLNIMSVTRAIIMKRLERGKQRTTQVVLRSELFLVCTKSPILNSRIVRTFLQWAKSRIGQRHCQLVSQSCCRDVELPILKVFLISKKCAGKYGQSKTYFDTKKKLEWLEKAKHLQLNENSIVITWTEKKFSRQLWVAQTVQLL